MTINKTVLMGCRESRQASTKHFPYYMLYQQHMRLPIDTELQMHDGSEDGEDDTDSEVIIEKLLQSREKVSYSATHTIDDAQKKHKETYNRKHLPEGLPIGVKILVENMAENRRGTKSSLAWSLHNY